MDNDETIRALKAHLAINVRNVQSSIGFYRRMLGIDPSKVQEGHAKFDLANPPLNFTLNEAPFGERGALSHMGIQVASTDDVLSMRNRWAREGLIPREEMKTDCCYALEDKAWVKDPDGNEWEVFAVLDDTLSEKSAATRSCCRPDCRAPAERAELAPLPRDRR
jgi:catechol 2,3-dioxygenase-like lactoylglutathione lyase family enzyme